ncbi:unnamed protein product [Dibothriocephalus latus]|uniref:Uncharacterized protein n=1 Tax=Dibothriocephalus latus TaxID=60516 RepID=A0A3P7M7S4_DIBLA|nr:unnamed protein product [Dibothriocephalus latus]
MYRLAHLHFTLESDLDKSMAILMGPFDHVTKVELGGLFKDRRQSNFFHGVWRIPTSDIDRSGNFAAHMYRSTSLVLEVLKKRGDWRRLLQVFHQLRKQPPEDNLRWDTRACLLEEKLAWIWKPVCVRTTLKLSLADLGLRDNALSTDASGPSISTEAVLKRCSELMPQSPSKASSTVQRVNLPLQGALSTS